MSNAQQAADRRHAPALSTERGRDANVAQSDLHAVAASRRGQDSVTGQDEAADAAGSQRASAGLLPRGRGRKRQMRLPTRLLSQIAAGVGILVLWHVVVSLGVVRPSLAATPAQVGSYLVEASAKGELWVNLVSTLTATIIAFILGSSVGIFVGVGLSLAPRLEAAIDPYLNAVNSMPRIALAPLFVIYFGFGTSAKVALAFTLVVFILIANARAGVLSTDRELIRLASAFNASKWQIITKILLPSSVPSMFAGLRVGLVYSLLGVVTSELIGAQEGLGARISFYAAAFNMEGIYGILIVLAVIGGLLNGGMRLAERYLLRWQEPGAGGGLL